MIRAVSATHIARYICHALYFLPGPVRAMEGKEREGEGFDWTQSQVMIIAFLSRMQGIIGDALQTFKASWPMLLSANTYSIFRLK